jgi:vacuolar-type H+-ATPase subunit F/Vma7
MEMLIKRVALRREKVLIGLQSMNRTEGTPEVTLSMMVPRQIERIFRRIREREIGILLIEEGAKEKMKRMADQGR